LNKIGEFFSNLFEKLAEYWSSFLDWAGELLAKLGDFFADIFAKLQQYWDSFWQEDDSEMPADTLNGLNGELEGTAQNLIDKLNDDTDAKEGFAMSKLMQLTGNKTENEMINDMARVFFRRIDRDNLLGFKQMQAINQAGAGQQPSNREGSPFQDAHPEQSQIGEIPVLQIPIKITVGDGKEKFFTVTEWKEIKFPLTGTQMEEYKNENPAIAPSIDFVRKWTLWLSEAMSAIAYYAIVFRLFNKNFK
jgi:hypothetical protein